MMNLITNYKLFSVIFFLLLSNGIAAQSNPVTEDSPLKMAMPILTVAPDAKASGMGDLGAATDPSINDQAWNCAKYVFNEYPMGISLSYIPWMRNVGTTNINLLYLTGYYRIGDRQALAASIRYFSLGDLTFMNSVGEVVRTSNPNEFAIDLSYSLRLSTYFSLGAAFRYLRSDLSGGYYTSESMMTLEPANGAAADVGFYYNQPIKSGGLISNVAAGLSIVNIGTKMAYAYDKATDKSYFLPTTLRLAGAMDMNIATNHSIAFSLELSKYLVPTPPVYAKDEYGNILKDENGNPVILAGMNDNVSVPAGMIQSFYDAPGGFSEELREIMLGVGTEYRYANFFKARAGFYYDPKNAQHRYVTLGAGIAYNIFTLDLSYLMPVVSGFQSPLANTIHVTLGVNLGQPGNKYNF